MYDGNDSLIRIVYSLIQFHTVPSDARYDADVIQELWVFLYNDTSDAHLKSV